MKPNKVTIKYIIGATVLLGIVGWLAWLTYSHIQLRKATETNSKQNLQLALRNAEEMRYKTPIIDMQNEQVYLYETGISIALTSTTKDLVYDMRDDQVYISLSGVIGRQNPEDIDTPPTCDKMILLAKDQITAPGLMEYVGEVDEKTSVFKHLYKHSSCSLFSDQAQTELLSELQKLQPTRR